MPKRNSTDSPKGVETRSTVKNADSNDLKKKQTQVKTKSQESSKVTKGAKAAVKNKSEKATKVNEAKSKSGQKSSAVKPTQTDQRDKAIKPAHSKNDHLEKNNSQNELLDYDETGLDQSVNQQGELSDQADGISSESESSESTSSSSDDSDSNESNSDVRSDFSEPNSGENPHGNTNNGASPQSDNEMEEPPIKKKKTKGLLRATSNKSKMVTMSTGDLQKLINDTIANYEKKQKGNDRTTEKSKCSESNPTPGGTKSDTTIYSRLCPPVVNSLPSPTNLTVSDNATPPFQGNPSAEYSEQNISDESLQVQFNSSDEINESHVIPGMTLPLPPPPRDNNSIAENAIPNTQHPKDLAQEKSAEMVRQAELQKAELAKPPGENQYLLVRPEITKHDNIDGSLDYLHNSGTAHVDSTTREKIKTDQYIELHRLLPRDLDLVDEDENLVLTSKMGKTYHVPPMDREESTINTFKKWQVAFKVFMSVYIEEHPHRLLKPFELIQYTQLIEGMTTTWIWDNVYKYDKSHRRMMQTFPRRKWHVPYDLGKQQLKVTHAMNPANSNPRYRKGGNPNKSKKEPCRNFNKGKCTYGAACRFDHRCSKCGKYGHNAVNCRAKDKEHSESQNLLALAEAEGTS